jgi:hypothetical protein
MCTQTHVVYRHSKSVSYLWRDIDYLYEQENLTEHSRAVNYKHTRSELEYSLTKEGIVRYNVYSRYVLDANVSCSVYYFAVATHMPEVIHNWVAQAIHLHVV